MPACTTPEGFDFDKLESVARLVTRNLNKTIDNNYYPIEQAKNSNFKHRPIGIGVQGLSDTFQILSLPYDSDKARQLNRFIFETIFSTDRT